jgi:hypothetical protein
MAFKREVFGSWKGFFDPKMALLSLLQSRQIPLHPPFPKGEKVEGILHRIPQSSPPFEKGRTGGISGKAFSKG